MLIRTPSCESWRGPHEAAQPQGRSEWQWLERSKSDTSFGGEGRSGFKGFQEGGITPAFILLAPGLSWGLVGSSPYRGSIPRCRGSLFSYREGEEWGTLPSPRDRQASRTQHGPRAPPPLLLPHGEWSATPRRATVTCCFLSKVRPRLSSSVASGITQGPVLILTSLPGANS